MEIRSIDDTLETSGHHAEDSRSSQNLKRNFESHLDEASSDFGGCEPVINQTFTLLPDDIELENVPGALSAAQVIPAYQKEAVHNPQISDWQKYKDDQLLSNPGGDAYYLEEGKVISDHKDQESFWGRIGKDLSDSFDNLKKSFKDLFLVLRYYTGTKIIKSRKQLRAVSSAQRLIFSRIWEAPSVLDTDVRMGKQSLWVS